jgi:hypothetical protein
MKLRFFGDSWCWSWLPKESIKSNALLTYSFGISDSVPLAILEWSLKNSGIETLTFNNPGACFKHTTETILDVHQVNNINDASYNIVFVSAPYRDIHDIPPYLTDYDKFIDAWDSTIVDCLVKIQQWAVDNDQQVLLLGGHHVIEKRLLDSLDNKENMHLFSECIVSELSGQDKKGRFRFGDFYQVLDTKTDKRLIDEVWNDVSKIDNQVKDTLFWPDRCHLNPTAMVLLADKILYKIEKLEGEK